MSCRCIIAMNLHQHSSMQLHHMHGHNNGEKKHDTAFQPTDVSNLVSFEYSCTTKLRSALIHHGLLGLKSCRGARHPIS